MLTETKTCPGCGATKLLAEFYPRYDNPDKRRKHCIACEIANALKPYKADPARENALRSARKRLARQRACSTSINPTNSIDK